MTEVVTVADVNTGNNGWYEIELVGDDRIPATKDKKIVDALVETAGTPVTVEIGHKKSKDGQFDNYYLNKIIDPDSPVAELAPKTEAKPKAMIPGQKAKVDPTTSSKAQEDKQKSIQAQWAFGRATELLVGSGHEYAWPLDTETAQALAHAANVLLVGANTLASK